MSRTFKDSREWMLGYDLGTRIVNHHRRVRGWAGGKGRIKIIIHNAVRDDRADNPFRNGQIAAILDSVN
jgi:hypothetical protein